MGLECAYIVVPGRVSRRTDLIYPPTVKFKIRDAITREVYCENADGLHIDAFANVFAVDSHHIVFTCKGAFPVCFESGYRPD